MKKIKEWIKALTPGKFVGLSLIPLAVSLVISGVNLPPWITIPIIVIALFVEGIFILNVKRSDEQHKHELRMQKKQAEQNASNSEAKADFYSKLLAAFTDICKQKVETQTDAIERIKTRRDIKIKSSNPKQQLTDLGKELRVLIITSLYFEDNRIDSHLSVEMVYRIRDSSGNKWNYAFYHGYGTKNNNKMRKNDNPFTKFLVDETKEENHAWSDKDAYFDLSAKAGIKDNVFAGLKITSHKKAFAEIMVAQANQKHNIEVLIDQFADRFALELNYIYIEHLRKSLANAA